MSTNARWHTSVVAERASKHVQRLASDLVASFNNVDLFADQPVVGEWESSRYTPIQCHKALLYLRCPAFRSFIDTHQKAKEEPPFCVARLKTPRLLTAFLKFLYTDTLSADELTVFEALKLWEWGESITTDDSSSYMTPFILNAFKRQCSKVLRKNLALKGAFKLLKKSDKKKILEAKWYVVYFIVRWFERKYESEEDNRKGLSGEPSPSEEGEKGMCCVCCGVLWCAVM